MSSYAVEPPGGVAREYGRGRTNLFFYILLIETTASFTGVGEAYLILKVTAGQTSVLTAYRLESL
jgi:hypothetical protein